ncbi:MAG: hypothetical protein Q9227_004784 [Pyrenula ochraceoflavens]
MALQTLAQAGRITDCEQRQLLVQFVGNVSILATLVENGTIDPFDTMVVKLTKGMQTLLRIACTDVALKYREPGDPDTQRSLNSLRRNLDSKAALFATLALGSFFEDPTSAPSNQEFVKPSKTSNSYRFLSLKQKSIQEINSALEGPSKGKSNSIVFAITQLIASTLFTCLCLDLCPILPPPPIAIPPKDTPATTHSKDWLCRLAELDSQPWPPDETLKLLNQEIISFLRGARRYQQWQDSLKATVRPGFPEELFATEQTLSYIFINNLLTSIHSKAWNTWNGLDKCAARAAILYYANYNQILNSPFIQLQTHRLYTTVGEHINFSTLDKQKPESIDGIAWILIIAIDGSIPGSEMRTWFVEGCASVFALKPGLQHWTNLKVLLERFCCVSSSKEASIQEAWSEVLARFQDKEKQTLKNP